MKKYFENLGLSSLAAFQTPIIMMSQNRQAAKDRVKQDAAYEINVNTLHHRPLVNHSTAHGAPRYTGDTHRR